MEVTINKLQYEIRILKISCLFLYIALSSIVFLCDNTEEYCRTLKTKGVIFVKELKDIPWGKFASFQDTDGNEFLLKG